jgi:Dolichyl-phosphate-mannose-protein mannosyltransferase
MSMSGKSLPSLFFSMFAISYFLWLVNSVADPLWTDEAITIALVKSATLAHLFSGVLLGLDATPPLYTSYGWLMLHNVVPGWSPELLLRVTNAGLVGATIWILYLLARQFFDRITALMTIGMFVLLELWDLKSLTLDVRSYATMVFATTLAIYVSLRAVSRPSWGSWLCTALAYSLLVTSHTFGIIYVVCIAICAIIAAFAEGDIGLTRNSGLVALPAIVMFVAWLPVLHYQAQLGDWLPRPGVRVLLMSTFLPTDSALLLMVPLIVAALIVLWRRTPDREGPMLTRWWQSLNRMQKFVILLPLLFGASTFAIWIFSRVIFPVFLVRYFVPNMVLHIIWLSCLTDFVFSYITRSTTRCGLVLALAVLTGLIIIGARRLEPDEGGALYWPLDTVTKIPCFDASRNVYLEDSFKDAGSIVALSLNIWFSRLHLLGNEDIFPIDKGDLMNNGPNDRGFAFQDHFVSRFAEWLGVHTVMPTEKLLNEKQDFMVLDDQNGPWLKIIRRSHKLDLTLLAKMRGCRLWRVKVLK